ncbi:MAG: hypothetical protein WD847_20370 [Pirellulales bacterium]
MHLAAQAKTERAIVREFERHRWIPVIENPLTGEDAEHARRNAVTRLNHRQQPLRVEFASLSAGRIGCFCVA